LVKRLKRIKPMRRAAMLTPLLFLAACTTPQGPVEVTRFVDTAGAARLGQGTVFVESAPGSLEGLEAAPYKAAVAAELSRLGYRESDRSSASQIAQVRVDRFVETAEGRRSPVSVGVGGSTGSYGSGVGLGIGINLGGGKRPQTGTQLGVTLRDARSGSGSGVNLWEGRAELRTTDKSPLADRTRNAQALAAALFRDFPGRSGETVQVKVSE
jgi:hypothetical protein